MLSPPFDIGTTTVNGLSPLEERVSAHASKSAAAYHNMGSLSNGAQMRMSPMAVWSSRLPVDQQKLAIITDCEFTHPNQQSQESILVHSSAIAYLLHNQTKPGKAMQAFKKAEEIA
jgi:ADP-ribosylglycohydrolase